MNSEVNSEEQCKKPTERTREQSKAFALEEDLIARYVLHDVLRYEETESIFAFIDRLTNHMHLDFMAWFVRHEGGFWENEEYNVQSSFHKPYKIIMACLSSVLRFAWKQGYCKFEEYGYSITEEDDGFLLITIDWTLAEMSVLTKKTTIDTHSDEVLQAVRWGYCITDEDGLLDRSTLQPMLHALIKKLGLHRAQAGLLLHGYRFDRAHRAFRENPIMMNDFFQWYVANPSLYKVWKAKPLIGYPQHEQIESMHYFLTGKRVLSSASEDKVFEQSDPYIRTPYEYFTAYLWQATGYSMGFQGYVQQGMQAEFRKATLEQMFRLHLPFLHGVSHVHKPLQSERKMVERVHERVLSSALIVNEQGDLIKKIRKPGSDSEWYRTMKGAFGIPGTNQRLQTLVAMFDTVILQEERSRKIVHLHQHVLERKNDEALCRLRMLKHDRAWLLSTFCEDEQTRSLLSNHACTGVTNNSYFYKPHQGL